MEHVTSLGESDARAHGTRDVLGESDARAHGTRDGLVSRMRAHCTTRLRLRLTACNHNQASPT